MGLVHSPLVTIIIFSWYIEVITGDRKMSSNHLLLDVLIQKTLGPFLMTPPCQGFTDGIQSEG